MKLRRILVVTLLALGSCLAQSGVMMKVPNCLTPTGAHGTESFGDSTSLCWTAGPFTCNNTWTITGTAQSIVGSPAGASSNTACANSLQMAVTTASLAALSIADSVVTSFDAKGTFYLTSAAFGSNSDSLDVVCFDRAASLCDSSRYITMQVVRISASQYALQGNGVAPSSSVNVSTGTWYTWDLHYDSVTAANCSLSVNGGAAQTFTCNSGGPGIDTAFVGNGHFTPSGNVTYIVGNWNF